MSDNPTSADWGKGRGGKWAAELPRMEAMLAPVDGPLLDRARLDTAVRVADIACGGGGTTRKIAARAPTGSVVRGFDISPELVAAARDRAADAPVTFEVADVGRSAPPASFDRLISRFGVMFFEDPPAAFANLSRWLAPGGRFAFAVWAPPSDNPWMSGTREVLARIVDLPRPDPDAPGPFRYADVRKLCGLLEGAGFTDVEATDWRGELALGGGLSAEGAATFAVESFAAFADAIAAAGPTASDAAKRALEAFFRPHEQDGVVKLAARVHLVTGGVSLRGGSTAQPG